VSDLAEFVLARIAEEESTARKLLATAQRVSLTLADPKWLGLPAPGWYAWPEVEALCARTIAGCEARRRIVGRLETARRTGSSEAWRLISALFDLAAVYADHPDYRQEWRA
jgi:hypothetical protein